MCIKQTGEAAVEFARSSAAARSKCFPCCSKRSVSLVRLSCYLSRGQFVARQIRGAVW